MDADFLKESPGPIFRAEVCMEKNWLGYTGMEDGYSDPQEGRGDCGKGGRMKAILGHFPVHHSYWPRVGSISFLLRMGLDDHLSYNLPIQSKRFLTLHYSTLCV
jgi:hypothetical protein